MLFCAINLHDLAAPPGIEEEALLVVPGAARAAVAVPLDALAHVLPLLEQAIGRDAWPQCPACGATIPRLEGAVCAGSQCPPTDLG